jgi:hypothetical protein
MTGIFATAPLHWCPKSWMQTVSIQFLLHPVLPIVTRTLFLQPSSESSTAFSPKDLSAKGSRCQNKSTKSANITCVQDVPGALVK